MSAPPQQPPTSSNPPSQSYPAVSPYPPSTGNGAPQPSVPAAGPGSGFPARSGLAGLQLMGMGTSSSPGAGGGGAGLGLGSMPQMGGSGGGGYSPHVPGSGAGIRGGGGLPEEKNVAQLVQEHTNKYARRFQMILDRSTPMVVERWLGTLGVFLLFALNVILRQGWYIVCYALAIYILNLFLAFLQPRFDPSVQADLAADDVEEGAPGLPGSGGSGGGAKGSSGIKGLMGGFRAEGDDEEFRPFIRRLPEFKFWYSATKACVIALVCTITRATDVPVYWPILLIYFFTLFGITMRRQIQHMIKYKYVPFDLGKSKYGRSK